MSTTTRRTRRTKEKEDCGGGGGGGGGGDADMNYSELSDLAGKETPASPSEDSEESISVLQKVCAMRLGRQRLTKMKGQTKLTTHKNSTRECCKWLCQLHSVFCTFFKNSRVVGKRFL
jgi:hypothetical protein